jgi:starch synthase
VTFALTENDLQRLAYNEALSMAIYSGADLFLMPSKSEPCGLSQMIAMRYGTVPIVRETGGLADTVRSCQAGQRNGNGFTFANYNEYDMLYTIGQAVAMYRDNRETFRKVQYNGMTDDFSWGASARSYRNIYASIVG